MRDKVPFHIDCHNFEHARAPWQQNLATRLTTVLAEKTLRTLGKEFVKVREGLKQPSFPNCQNRKDLQSWSALPVSRHIIIREPVCEPVHELFVKLEADMTHLHLVYLAVILVAELSSIYVSHRPPCQLRMEKVQSVIQAVPCSLPVPYSRPLS